MGKIKKIKKIKKIRKIKKNVAKTFVFIRFEVFEA